MVTKEKTYTEEFVSKELDTMLANILKDPEIIYIGQLFEKTPYTRQRFCEWGRDFSQVDKISDTIKKIKNILETRINVGGLKNDLNAKMVVFNLINNYSENWKNTDKLDVTTGGEKIKGPTIYLPDNKRGKPD